MVWQSRSVGIGSSCSILQTHISAAHYRDLDDASFLLNLEVDYLGLENVSIYIVGNLFSGNSDSEFGMFHQSSSFGAGVEYFF